MINRYHIQYTDSGTTQVTRNMAGLNAVAKSGTSIMSSYGTAIAGLATAYLGFQGLTKAISVIKEFDTTMLEVKAVTKATAGEFDALSEAARKMGAETRFSASQAGEAILALSRAGFDTNKVLAALPDTLNLAIAGVLEISEAADIAAITISQFNLRADEASRVSDVFVTAANSSNQTVRDLAESMKYAGAAASSVGVDLETTAAAMEVLANNGIRGSMAGTTMREVLLSLSAETESARATLDKLGLTFDDVSLKNNTISQAFGKLAKAGAELGDMQQIFSQRAATGAIKLAQYSGEIAKFTEKNREATVAAKTAAETMDSGLNASFLKLKSVTEELMLKMGDSGFKQVLTGITDVMIFIVEDTNRFITQLNQLGNVVGKFAFISVRAFEEILESAGSVGFALVQTFQTSFSLIYDSVYEYFGQIGEAIFELINGGGKEKKTITQIFADNWKTALKDIDSTWEITSKNIKKNLEELGQDYKNIDFFSAYKAALPPTKAQTKEIENQTVAVKKLGEAYSGIFGPLNETSIISTDSLIPPEVLDNSTEQIQTWADENADIIEVFSRSTTSSLTDMFTNVGNGFAGFMDNLTRQIIQLMTNQWVGQFFGMLGGIGTVSPTTVGGFGSTGVASTLSLGMFNNTGGFGALLGGDSLGGGYEAGVPRLTGEHGPEIDVPSMNGRILSRNDAMRAVSGNNQPVNVKILNNVSKEGLMQFFNSSEGEKIIVNTIGKNKKALGF